MLIQLTLIDACIRGERKAEYELFKLCYPYLMSICMRYTRNADRAREVLNIGFYRILSQLDKFDRISPFKPWARRLMINTLINEYKKEKVHYHHVEYVEDYRENTDYSELNASIGRADVEEIYAFIAQLNPASQQVFNLYFIDGYKHKEIAEMLNISEGTSKWHLNAAREKLKTMLAKEVATVKENQDE